MKLSNYHTILQITQAGSVEYLDRAYQSSKARYERLTARGPLRFYRKNLLRDVETAYMKLRSAFNGPLLIDKLSRDRVLGGKTMGSKSMTGKQLGDNTFGTMAVAHSCNSILSRQARRQKQQAILPRPTKSPVKEGTILSSEPLALKSRTLRELRGGAASNHTSPCQQSYTGLPSSDRSGFSGRSAGPTLSPQPPGRRSHKLSAGEGSTNNSAAAEVNLETKSALDLDRRQKAFWEDKFCLEVIYRLEGDLIRYQSRQELLGLAQEWGIHLFRANMLIAQIVEAVRQQRLYLPSSNEQKISLSGQRASLSGLTTILVLVILLALLIDFVLIDYLGW